MRIANVFKVVDAHTGGEAVRVILSGFPRVPAKTMLERQTKLQQSFDHLRRQIILEPRGHNDMFGVLLTEPCDSSADYGIIFMDNLGFSNENLAGHAIIGVSTVLVETGMVQKKEPFTTVSLDTPAGLVRSNILIDEGNTKSVSVTMVPSISLGLDQKIKTPSFGEILVDISYGGQLNAIVDSEDQLGIKLSLENAPKIVKAGLELRDALNSQLSLAHPIYDHIDRVYDVVLRKPNPSDGVDNLTADIGGQGQLDRSPCGTATCSTMAMLYKRGKLKVDQSFVNASLTGAKFTGRIVGKEKIKGVECLIPEITGSAYITGFNTHVVCEDDPLRAGFAVPIA